MSRKWSWLGPGLIAAAPLLGAQEERVLMPEDLFRRNIGTREQMNTRFPPHRIIGNVYYVGTYSLGSFLVATPAGHVLINTSYETTVPAIRQSVEELGFRFEDIEIILGSHAHGDHMQGDALVRELTGARVMAVAEEVPLLETLTPGGKPHPIPPATPGAAPPGVSRSRRTAGPTT